MGKWSQLKVIIILCVLFFFSWKGEVLADCDILVEEGKTCLKNLDFVCANTKFEAALGECPDHEEANFYFSLTRIAVLLDNTELSILLDRFGIDSAGRNILNWTADFQRDLDGKIVLPADSPASGEVINYLETYFLPEIDGALANLDKVGTGFSSNFLYDVETIEFDYGDAAFYKAGLLFTKFLIDLVRSYDLVVDIDDLLARFNGSTCYTIVDVLNDYTNLLQLNFPHYLSESGDALSDAVDAYNEASASVRNETDDQSNDFIVIDNEDYVEEAYYRGILQDIQNSLSSTTLVDLGETQSWVLQDSSLPGGGRMEIILDKNMNLNGVGDSEYYRSNFTWPPPLGVPCYGEIKNYQVSGNVINFDIIANEVPWFDCPCNIHFTGTLSNDLNQIISGSYNGVNNAQGPVSGSFTGFIEDRNKKAYNLNLSNFFSTDYNLKSFIPVLSEDNECNVTAGCFPDDTFGGVLPDGLDDCVEPTPDIKANGSDGSVTPTDNLLVTVALDPGSRSGENADWWAVVNTPFDPPSDWYYYDLNMGWTLGLLVTHQGSLFDLPPFEVLSMSGLPTGNYTFYFGVDMVMNGSLDMSDIFYDSVIVNITP